MQWMNICNEVYIDGISNILLHIHHISRYAQLTITFRIDSTIMIFMCYFWHVLNFRKSSICKHFNSPFDLKLIRQKKRTAMFHCQRLLYSPHILNIKWFLDIYSIYSLLFVCFLFINDSVTTSAIPYIFFMCRNNAKSKQ